MHQSSSSAAYSKDWKNDTKSSLPALRNKLKPTRVILSSPKKPSTPSANDAILGFGSQASRVFDSSTELPSPGVYYTRAFRDPIGQSKSPSYSNLGYSSGFVSMDPRERSCSYIPPNPATKLVADHYDLPRSLDFSDATMNWQGHTYPFLGEPQDRVAYEEFSWHKEVPGPAKYSLDGHYDSRGPKFQRNTPSAGFQSMTNRRSHIHAALQSSNSPGPGIYLNSDYAPRPESPCSAVWTRSHTPRFLSPPRSATNIKYMTTHSQENNSFESPSIAITPSTFVRSRSAGACSGSKGKLFEPPASPVRFFGSEVWKGTDNPRRFRTHSFNPITRITHPNISYIII